MIGQLLIQLATDDKRLVAGLKRSERHLKRSARNLGRMGDSINRNLGVPMALISGASFKLYKDLATNISKIENLVGISGGQLDAFKDGVKNISKETATSQAALSEALFVVTSAGARGAEAMGILASSAKAAKVGLGETKEIARAVTGVLKSYAGTGLTAAQATDTLFKVVREGNLEAESLAPVLGRVTGLAAELGISFGEVGANVATFTRLGVSAEEAVTGLRAVMTTFLKPSKQAEEALAEYGLTAAKVRDMIGKQGLAQTLVFLKKTFGDNIDALGKVIPNVRALGNFLGVTGGQAEEYIRISKDLASTNNDVAKAFENLDDDIMAVDQAMVDARAAGSSMGKVVAPVISDLARGVSGLANRFSDLDDETKDNIVRMGLWTIAAGGTLKMSSMVLGGLGSMVGGMKNLNIFLGRTAKGFKTLDATMKITTIGAVVAGIALAVVAYKNLTASIDAVAAKRKMLNDIEKESSSAAELEMTKLKPLIDTINDTSKSVDERREALKRLKQTNADYFGDLNTEKINLEAVSQSLERYRHHIYSVAKAKAVQARMTELSSKKLELEKKVTDIGSDKFRMSDLLNGLPGMGGQGRFIELKKVADEINNIDKQMSALAKTAYELDKINNKSGTNNSLAGVTNSTVDNIQGASYAGGGSSDPWTKPNDIKMSPLAGIFDVEADPASGFESMNEEMDKSIDVATRLDQAFLKLRETIAEPTFLEFAGQFTSTMQQMAMDGATSFADLGAAALKAGQDQVRAFIFSGVAGAISNVMGSSPLGLLLAPAAGAAASALFNSVLGGLSIPALAGGAIASGPQLAMIGEYSGANQNPELVMRTDMVENAAAKAISRGMGGGGAASVEVQTLSRYNRMDLAIKRSSRRNSRLG